MNDEFSGVGPEAKQSNAGKRKFTLSTGIVGAAWLIFAISGAATNGLAGFLVMTSIFAIATGLYTLIVNRPSWAKLSSRKAGAIVAGAGVVAMIAGGALLPPSEDANLATEDPAAKVEAVDDVADTPPLDPATITTLEADPSVAIPDSEAIAKPALVLLEDLQVKGRSPKTGYDRKAKFGSPWTDVDRNGCDTRNDVLQRDLTGVTLQGKCKVMTGLLADQYTGKQIDFVRGNKTSSLVQIDHVVALSDAWQKGAQQLTQEQRVTFANDPLNLLAVDGAANSSKGDGDAATWLPANKEFRCEYVARQVSVKATYGLWVTRAEKDAMKQVLSTCPNEPAPVSTFVAEPKPKPAPAPAPEPVPEPTPEPAHEPAPEYVPEPTPAPEQSWDVFYQNCDAVRAAGAAPIYSGDPGYSRKLDRDGDGIGCE